MWHSLFAFVWAFVFVAAGYDAHFAWVNQSDFQQWEGNPLARWAAAELGMQTLVVIKFAGLAMAAALALYCHLKHRALGRPVTLTAALAYAFLSLHYVANSHERECEVVMSCLRSIYS